MYFTIFVERLLEHEDIEEDDYQEYLDTAKELQQNEDIYLGVVTNPKTSKWFKSNKTIDRTPAILIAGEDDSRKTINLDELYGERSSTKEWILKSAVPLVGKLTGQNFGLYEKLQIPMLMMFLVSADSFHPCVHSLSFCDCARNLTSVIFSTIGSALPW